MYNGKQWNDSLPIQIGRLLEGRTSGLDYETPAAC